MRIGIDARFLGPDGTGIGRYVEKLLENLEQLDQANEYFVFLRKSNFPLYNPKNKNFTKVTVDAHWYSIKEQVIMPAVLNKLKLDLVHFPHFNIPLLYSGKFVVTIHDLTKTKFGRSASGSKNLPVYWTKNNIYKFTINQALKRAEKILVPSNFVKNEIAKENKNLEKKIVVTYEAADDFANNHVEPSEGRVKEIYNKFGIREPFIIYVGNTYAYKNVAVILETLPKIDFNLKFVCVSPRDTQLAALIKKAEILGVRDRFITTGFVNDEDLKTLFSKALCFVFPSLSEGFGLPGLEAMACGCPVIAARASSLPEVYGEAALYFNPKSDKDLAEKINELLKNKLLRSKMVEKGLKKVREYYWRDTARQTLSVYKEILDR